jgi:hypothetical protein
MLRHPWLDENSAEEEGRIKLSVMPDGPAAPTYLFMSISVGSGEEAPAQQWSVGLELLPRFIEATSPLAAFFNLKDVDDESYRMFPPMAGILRSQFPDALPPVFYIDEAKLGDSPRMSWLATLPAQRFVALPRGKLIIAIASPRNKASAEFIAALEAAPSGPICFIPPQLPS